MAVQDVATARAQCIVCTEAQLNSTDFFDEMPTIGIESLQNIGSWLSARQRIFSKAIALRKGAHLTVLTQAFHGFLIPVLLPKP